MNDPPKQPPTEINTANMWEEQRETEQENKFHLVSLLNIDLTVIAGKMEDDLELKITINHCTEQ